MCPCCSACPANRSLPALLCLPASLAGPAHPTPAEPWAAPPCRTPPFLATLHPANCCLVVSTLPPPCLRCSTPTPHSSRTAGGATRGSSRTVLSETERRSSRLGSLLGISSGRLGSASASGLLARWAGGWEAHCLQNCRFGLANAPPWPFATMHSSTALELSLPSYRTCRWCSQSRCSPGCHAMPSDGT